MARDDVQRAMSDERLAEIKRRHQQCKRGKVVTVYGQAELFREWLDNAAADESARPG